MVMQDIKAFTREISGFFFTPIKQSKYTQYINFVGYFAFAVVVIAASYQVYGWHVARREQSAQKGFSKIITHYQQSLQTDENWPTVAEECAYVSRQHSSSYLSPFLKAFEANSLAYSGNKDVAISAMEDATKHMPAKPLGKLFALSQSLLLLDSADQSRIDEGLSLLQQLASDEANEFRDAALFYLGQYFWIADELDQAQDVWMKLVEYNAVHQLARSPWADYVENKLALIS